MSNYNIINDTTSLRLFIRKILRENDNARELLVNLLDSNIKPDVTIENDTQFFISDKDGFIKEEIAEDIKRAISVFISDSSIISLIAENNFSLPDNYILENIFNFYVYEFKGDKTFLAKVDI